MSWIVESLLNDRDRIKERADIESDEFNDLLLIERAIETLMERDIITKDDLAILHIPGGYTKAESITSLERHTISKRRGILCERVAYFLGGYFTDDGYLDYFQKKYKLDDLQIDTLKRYIKGKKKHQIIRKPINDEQQRVEL